MNRHITRGAPSPSAGASQTSATARRATSVTLEWNSPHEGWQLVGKGATDPDGRLRTLMSEGGSAPPGLYRLQFATGAYFQERGTAAFHPHITVTVEVLDGEAHHHVPLLVSPFGYTTYRGS